MDAPGWNDLQKRRQRYGNGRTSFSDAGTAADSHPGGSPSHGGGHRCKPCRTHHPRALRFAYRPRVQSTLTGPAPTIALSQQVLEFARWFREIVPGCDQWSVSAVANRVGVRESVRIIGRHTLSRDEMLSAKARRDAIAQAAFPIDIHEPGKSSLSHTEQLSHPFGTPYGCLVADGLENLLMAGRCISSAHVANASVRWKMSCRSRSALRFCFRTCHVVVWLAMLQ